MIVLNQFAFYCTYRLIYIYIWNVDGDISIQSLFRCCKITAVTCCCILSVPLAAPELCRSCFEIRRRNGSDSIDVLLHFKVISITKVVLFHGMI